MDRALIASRLREYRRAHRLTQAGLSAATGGEVSRSRIADYEQMKGSPPTIKAVRALARAMGVQYEALSGDPEPTGDEGSEALVLRYRLVPGTRLTPEQEERARRVVKSVLKELGYDIGEDRTPRPRKKKD